MATQRQYWVVSPNVKEDEKTVAAWKNLILRTHVAIMGWSPDEYGHRQFGPKFAGKTARSIQLDDIILIARRHDWEPDVVGLGVVKGECEERLFPAIFSDHVWVRRLKPFVPLKLAPRGIPLHDILNFTGALRQLHPDDQEKHAHSEVCEWIKAELGLVDKESDSGTIYRKGRSRPRTFDYEERTPEQVKKARRREEKLLYDYERWLKKQKRHLEEWHYGRIWCDGWEQERGNLIEAKGSIGREDIRMAVGQLFDYAFQGREKLNAPHLAILLPEKPPPKRVQWLEPLGIKIIWRTGRLFLDNAKGRFT